MKHNILQGEAGQLRFRIQSTVAGYWTHLVEGMGLYCKGCS
jgi:hypothetical protein